jgi:hypothetical protein
MVAFMYWARIGEENRTEQRRTTRCALKRLDSPSLFLVE